MASPKQTIFIGDRFINNFGTTAVVIQYYESKKVLVQFEDEYKHRQIFNGRDLKVGAFKNPYDRTTFGVGFCGVGEFKQTVEGVKTPAFSKWDSMMRRCYTEGYAEVHKDWHNFQNFARWFYDQPCNDDPTWELDKDLLADTNWKIYGPDTCCIVPRRLNKLFVGKKGNNGLPQGVRLNKELSPLKPYVFKAWYADGTSEYSKGYSTPEEAFSEFKRLKEEKIKIIAKEYEHILPSRVYEAVINFEVQP